jgi:hypothetical protein
LSHIERSSFPATGAALQAGKYLTQRPNQRNFLHVNRNLNLNLLLNALLLCRTAVGF